MKITSLHFVLLLCLISLNSFAQKESKPKSAFAKAMSSKTKSANGHIRCVTTEYEASLVAKNPKRASRVQFESWIADKISDIKARKSNTATASPNTVLTIPVVVHVIHNGDAKGTNENISDAQVISQITVLNQDFRRMLGTPGYNTNAVGADVEIEFCLAQRDPNGEATNGIDRVNLGVASWGESAVENTLKPQTQWDPTQYFNIWVCNFGGDLDGILGYAQFPSNSGLGGMEVDGGDADTDGVIIGYKYFGSSDIYPNGNYETPYDKGRTTTHEIGHCFGLIHIWGDNSSCSVNATDSNKDYCPDTPAASEEHYGCTADNSCPSAAGNDMIENYMDYSDDSCMNIFTANQKARIQAVMQNSIRRASLATSLGCMAPQSFGLDGKLDVENLNLACGSSFAPTVTLENKGTETLTSAVITYSVDNSNAQTYTWSGNLVANASEIITLPTLTATAGAHTFYSSLTTANEMTDDNLNNNDKSETFTIAASYQTNQVVFTLQRDRFGSETSWDFKNSTGTILYSGGPYSDTNNLPAVITQTFTVSANECYTLTVNDEYGDGICCTYGNGYYNLKTTTGTVIVSGTEFDMAVTKFAVASALGTDGFNALNKMTLYPNPAKNILNVSVPTELGLPDGFVIYNTLGQTIKTAKVGSLENLSIDTSALSNGVYLIKVSKGSESKTMQFIKN